MLSVLIYNQGGFFRTAIVGVDIVLDLYLFSVLQKRSTKRFYKLQCTDCAYIAPKWVA